MKKILAACLIAGLTLSMSGCALSSLVEKIASIGDSNETEVTEVKPRVYMDELTGILLDFTGNTITINAAENTYLFDVSDAVLECSDGLLSGNEISIIYEGKLPETGTDTGGIHVLRVADSLHKKEALTSQMISGSLQDITANTLSLRDTNNGTYLFSIPGCKSSYRNGIRKGETVYIHYYGQLPQNTSDTSMTVDANLVKVISISDTEPFSVLRTPLNKSEDASSVVEGSVYSLSAEGITILPDGSDSVTEFDLSGVPAYFPAGTAAGTRVTVTCTGSEKSDSGESDVRETRTLLSIIGIDPAKTDTKELNCHADGIILASSANTVTIKTGDQAVLTFRTDTLQEPMSAELKIGSRIRAVFQPQDTPVSNLYTCLTIKELQQ